MTMLDQSLAEIRADEVLHPLPIIVLSTSSNPRDVEHCYRGGANAYHVKPMRYDDHLQLLQGLVVYWLATVLLPGVSD